MLRTPGRFVMQNTGERNRVCQRLVDKTTASFCSVNRDARPGWETRFSYGERQRPRSSDTPAWMRACMVETTSIMFDVGVIATMGFIGAAFASRARVPIIIGYIIAGMLIGPIIHLHAVRQNSVVRPAEQPQVDVGDDQHTRDDVADDDRHTRARCEGGSDETHRGDDAHVEHDRGRLNHARTHPGGCVAGARALTLSVGEPSFPSRPRIAVHATKRCCCLVDQPLTNPIPFSGVLHHEPARRSQHALIRTSPLSITPSRTRSPWRRWTAARSAMLR